MGVVDVSESGPGTPHRLTPTQAREPSASTAVNVEPNDDNAWIVSGNGKVGVVSFGQVTPLMVRHDDSAIDIAENHLVLAAAVA